MSRPTDDTLPIADRNSEKYLKKLVGRTDIEDALSRLDKLTQEEARMAIAQVLKVAHHIEDGVKTVGDNVKDVDDKINLAIEGTLSSSATHKPIINPYTTRRQGSKSDLNGNKNSGATDGKQYRRS